MTEDLTAPSPINLQIKRIGVDQVVVTGVQTPNCIRGTVWDANSLDY